MNLYLKSHLPLEELAGKISDIALSSFARELRDGLNLGGGEYFKFSRNGAEVLLVCNDAQHFEVFIESMQHYPYYFYVWEGEDTILEEIQSSLVTHGFECELSDET